jgi:hypothetical protein
LVGAVGAVDYEIRSGFDGVGRGMAIGLHCILETQSRRRWSFLVIPDEDWLQCLGHWQAPWNLA